MTIGYPWMILPHSIISRTTVMSFIFGLFKIYLIEVKLYTDE